MKRSGNTILITGGNGGIGSALAHRFHDAGNHVIVTGRQRAGLDEACAGRPNMSAYVLDVDNPKEIEAFAARVVADHPSLNVLINNAGIMRYEALDRRGDLADAEATVTTNLLGPMRMTNALVEHLAGQSDSVIINVSSGLAYVPLMATPTYSATKAAIHSYTGALREALKGKVEVIELVPPALQTELTPGQSKRPGYMPLGEFIDEVMTLFDQQPTPAEILVQRVFYQRFAEQENRYETTMAEVNERVRQARAAQ